MEKKICQPGEIIREKGQSLDSLMLILDGTVSAGYEGGEIQLNKGDVIGIADINSDTYLMTARAVTQTTVVSYAYTAGGLLDFLKKQAPESIKYYVISIFHQVLALFAHHKKQTNASDYLYRFFTKNHARYLEMCEKNRITPRILPGQEDLSAPVMDDEIDPWLDDCYKGLYELVLKTSEPAPNSLAFYHGLIMMLSQSTCGLIRANRHIQEYCQRLLDLFINEERQDFLELYTTAYIRAYHLSETEKPDAALIKDTITVLNNYGVFENEYFRFRIKEYNEKLKNADKQKPAAEEAQLTSVAELHDSLSLILEYAACPNEVNEVFRTQLGLYKKTVNKTSAEEADRRIRNTLTNHFYEIYNAVVLKSLDDKELPRVIKMFLHFGYMDEELAGAKNAAYLYNIVDHIPTDPEKGVYTFYEWLLAIYQGKKEPSRNEFDSDYNDYVNELTRANKITKEEAANMLSDTRQKVLFELNSVFPTVNKVTNGRITTFCPVFSEHLILKTLTQMLINADMIAQSLGEIRGKDFSVFCREAVYSNPEIGVTKEMITVEILPDIILAPNIGVRGIMWQEIEGKRRTTPSRFMLSIFHAEDYQKIITRLVGDFRWEMCKRIQGARWNDTSEPSLTSDYADYLASYRKNSELSSDVKAKIKSDLNKCKNSTKEMFISDYQNWLLYESNGSPRLNKVVRAIMFSYCPFSSEIRQKIRTNPFYSEAMEKYDIRLKAKIKHYVILSKSLSNKGFKIPAEIEETTRLMKL